MVIYKAQCEHNGSSNATKEKDNACAVAFVCSYSVQNVSMQYFRSVSLCADLVLSLCRYTLCWCARGAQSLTGTSYCGGQSAFLLREGTIPRWVSRQTFKQLYFQNILIGVLNQGSTNSYFPFGLAILALNQMVSNPVKYLKDAFLNMPAKYAPDFMEHFLPWCISTSFNFSSFLSVLIFKNIITCITLG